MIISKISCKPINYVEKWVLLSARFISSLQICLADFVTPLNCNPLPIGDWVGIKEFVIVYAQFLISYRTKYKGSLLPKVWQRKRNGLFLGSSWFHNYVLRVFSCILVCYWTNYFAKYVRIYVRTHFTLSEKQTQMKNGTLIGLDQFIIVQIASVWKGLVLLFIYLE